MTPTSILLFAAGFGTRMAPLTDTTPKPLIKVAGKPLLDHAIDQCEGLTVVVNTHYFADQIEHHLAGSNIQISAETNGVLETGGGLKHALPLLGNDPVFTMNTDAVWAGGNPIQTLTKAWHNDMEALLLMIPHHRAVGHKGEGVPFDIDDAGRLHKGSEYVYSGAQIIRTDRLAEIKQAKFSMWDLWNGMLTRGTMYGTPFAGHWCDVGQPDSIKLAEGMLKRARDV